MPRQNRVDPFGTIFATSAYGEWMGNRGRLHDAEKRIVRNWAGKAWIICALDFKGRRRELMSPDSYTELFFLDEPTALAAGHRPCAECRRAAFSGFKAAFAIGQAQAGHTVKTAADMDRVLHAERTDARADGVVAELPDGAMVELDGAAWLKFGDRLHRWTASGYEDSRAIPPGSATVLTPPSTIAALRAGYRPVFHPSVVDTAAPQQ